VLVVGCEPATLGDEFEGAMGLSAPVEAAVNGAIAMVESLIAKIVGQDGILRADWQSAQTCEAN
jgi:hypothetical protein